MRAIRIKNGVFSLLIFEALIISIVTIILMVIMYNIYTGLVYNESAEVLNLYSTITDSRLSSIQDMSFEVLSNKDIQRNLLQYINGQDSYAAYTALDSLYTQLFTRWVLDKALISMNFIFLDRRRVDTSGRRPVKLTEKVIDEIMDRASAADGSAGWIPNILADNTITLYRLIKDISGNGFKPLGVLMITVDANKILNYSSVVPQSYKPEMFCIADGQVLSQKPGAVDTSELMGFLKTSNSYDIVNHEGEQYFVSVKRLGLTGWKLVYMVSCRTLLSSINNMNIVYILMLLVIVIAVVLIGYHFANAISSPIALLTRNMKVVEGGNYTVAPEGSGTAGPFAVSEVIQLAESFSQMVKRIGHLINEVYLKQIMIMEMKYKMLQQQINPHFLYNTLDTINWKAIQSSNGDISVMVRSLSKMLRGSIKGPDVVTVLDDLRFTEDYIAIQSIRFEERLKFSAEIDPSVYACRIPRLSLQPIVENCIIHNLEKYSGVCEIRIHSSFADGKLEIIVEDNGRGADLNHVEMVLNGEAEAANSSIGLKNINERIKISFGEEYGVRVENREPVGTRVTLVLPVGEVRHEDIADS